MPTYKHNGEVLHCPKCGSKKLNAKENPYDEEMGYLGEEFFGSGGLGLGEPDSDSTLMTCLKCGYKFEVE